MAASTADYPNAEDASAAAALQDSGLAESQTVDPTLYTQNCYPSNKISFELFTYYCLIPAALIVLLLSFLVRRKQYARDVFGGRPGIVYPVNLLDEHRRRHVYVLAFCFALWPAVLNQQGQLPFSWTYKKEALGAVKVLASLIYAAQYYPIFATITTDNVWGLSIGMLYTWALGAVYAVEFFPCTNETWLWNELVIYSLGVLPPFVAVFLLCLYYPYRIVCRWRLQRRTTVATYSESGNFLHKNEDMYQVKHVKNIFKGKSIFAKPTSKLGKIFSKFYRVIPGFKYSTASLAALFMSMLTAWIIFIYTLQAQILVYESIKNHLKSFMLVNRPPFVDDIFLYCTNYTVNLTSVLVQAVDEVAYWAHVIEVCLYASLVISYLSVLSSVTLGLLNYRKHLIWIYAGRYEKIPRFAGAGPRSIVVSGTKYVGYQVAFSIWGFIVQSGFYFIVTVIVAVAICLPIRHPKTIAIHEWVFDMVYPIVLTIIGTMIILNLIVHFGFLLEGEGGKVVLGIDNRRWFMNFHYFCVFVNIAIGLVSCLLRVIYAAVLGMWALPQLTMSTLPRAFEGLDSGFTIYINMLKLENAHTNPVLVVFCNLLLESMNGLSQNERDLYTFVSDGAGKSILRRRLVMAKRKLRNRWAVLLTLYNNPGLCHLRKRYLAKLEEKDVQEDELEKKEENNGKDEDAKDDDEKKKIVDPEEAERKRKEYLKKLREKKKEELGFSSRS